jgi:glycosyltransferase involved in cell wall biosynthesis
MKPSKHRPRLVVNALALRPGGDAARTFLENVLQELPRAWPEAHVVALVREGIALTGTDAELVAVSGVSSGFTRIRSEWTTLPGLIRSLRADVFVNPNEAVPRAIDAPLVVVAQNLLFHCRHSGPVRGGPMPARFRSAAQFAYYRRQMPRAYGRARVVVVVSHHAAELLAERAALDLARVRVVPCGADRLPVLERTASATTKTLLAVGAIAHYKRLDIAVRALAALVEAGGDYRLVLAGEEWPGGWPPLAALAQELGIAERLQRVGVVHDTELAELYASAFAAVATSACESFGIPVAEAMRGGLPIVAIDEPWSRELAKDAAILVPPRPDALAHAIRSLEDESVSCERSLAGRKVAGLYTWSGTARGIAAAAQEAAESR